MDVRFETKHGNKAGKHEWLTPLPLVQALGPFDLDPCYSPPRPWETANRYFSEEDNGLAQDWGNDFAWVNPPYGDNTISWLEKCSEHRHCIALIFARTETQMFRRFIWERAKAIFFIYGRISFYHSTGEKADMTAGAPSCLVAWDDEGISRLSRLNNGKLLLINT